MEILCSNDQTLTASAIAKRSFMAILCYQDGLISTVGFRSASSSTAAVETNSNNNGDNDDEDNLSEQTKQQKSVSNTANGTALSSRKLIPPPHFVNVSPGEGFLLFALPHAVRITTMDLCDVAALPVEGGKPSCACFFGGLNGRSLAVGCEGGYVGLMDNFSAESTAVAAFNVHEDVLSIAELSAPASSPQPAADHPPQSVLLVTTRKSLIQFDVATMTMISHEDLLDGGEDVDGAMLATTGGSSSSSEMDVFFTNGVSLYHRDARSKTTTADAEEKTSSSSSTSMVEEEITRILPGAEAVVTLGGSETVLRGDGFSSCLAVCAMESEAEKGEEHGVTMSTLVVAKITVKRGGGEGDRSTMEAVPLRRLVVPSQEADDSMGPQPTAAGPMAVVETPAASVCVNRGLSTAAASGAANPDIPDDEFLLISSSKRLLLCDSDVTVVSPAASNVEEEYHNADDDDGATPNNNKKHDMSVVSLGGVNLSCISHEHNQSLLSDANGGVDNGDDNEYANDEIAIVSTELDPAMFPASDHGSHNPNSQHPSQRRQRRDPPHHTMHVSTGFEKFLETIDDHKKTNKLEACTEGTNTQRRVAVDATFDTSDILDVRDRMDVFVYTRIVGDGQIPDEARYVAFPARAKRANDIIEKLEQMFDRRLIVSFVNAGGKLVELRPSTIKIFEAIEDDEKQLYCRALFPSMSKARATTPSNTLRPISRGLTSSQSRRSATPNYNSSSAANATTRPNSSMALLAAPTLSSMNRTRSRASTPGVGATRPTTSSSYGGQNDNSYELADGTSYAQATLLLDETPAKRISKNTEEKMVSRLFRDSQVSRLRNRLKLEEKHMPTKVPEKIVRDHEKDLLDRLTKKSTKKEKSLNHTRQVFEEEAQRPAKKKMDAEEQHANVQKFFYDALDRDKRKRDALDKKLFTSEKQKAQKKMTEDEWKKWEENMKRPIKQNFRLKDQFY